LPQTAPRPILSTFFPVCHPPILIFDTVLVEMLTASFNKQ
jgi:hypothetical protein